MIYYDLTQRTADWWQMRLGIVTSSELHNVMARLVRKEGEAAARRTYRRKLAAERMTGVAIDNHIGNKPQIVRAVELEAIARTEYEMATNQEVTIIGGAAHDAIPGFWASTDGLVGDDGMLEIKCPNSDTHVTYQDEGVVPSEYHWEIIGGLMCAGRNWCDFVSFDDRFMGSARLFIKRFERSNTVEQLIHLAELEIPLFLREVYDLVVRLSQDSPGAANNLLQPGDKGGLNPIGEGR